GCSAWSETGGSLFVLEYGPRQSGGGAGSELRGHEAIRFAEAVEALEHPRPLAEERRAQLLAGRVGDAHVQQLDRVCDHLALGGALDGNREDRDSCRDRLRDGPIAGLGDDEIARGNVLVRLGLLVRNHEKRLREGGLLRRRTGE